MGVRGLRSGLQGAKETLREVKEAAKGVAAGFGAEDMVEATVLEDRGAEVRCQSAVRQDVSNRVGGKGFGSRVVGKGVILLAKAPEGICRIVTTWTEGFIAFGGAEFKGVVGIKAVTCGQLDTRGPVPTVEGPEEARCVRWEAIAGGFAKGNVGEVDSPWQVVIVVCPGLVSSVLAGDGGGKRGGGSGQGVLP